MLARQLLKNTTVRSAHAFRAFSSTTAPIAEPTTPAVKKNSLPQNDVDPFEEEWRRNASGVDEAWLTGRRQDDWWTGKHPEKTFGFSTKDNTLYSAPQPTLNGISAVAAQNYLDNTWGMTEVLFASLQGEAAFYKPPYHHLRHPMVFYYGHTPSFFVNKLQVAGVLPKGLNPYFEEIFEVGVDEMKWDDMSKNTMDWPKVSEVHAYRKEVFATLSDVIADELHKPTNVNQDHPLWSLFMGFEHERIHLETSSVLIRELPIELVRRPEYFPTRYLQEDPQLGDVAHYPRNELIPNNGGVVQLGKQDDFPSFGFDNEYGTRQVTVPPFEASKFKVTNGEFYEFVVDGGYRTEKYWSQEGWGWRKFRNAKWPFFWRQDGPQGSHRYKLRTLFEEAEVPWSAPAVVNYHEAKAFLAWKSEKLGLNSRPLRLVSEAEHQFMRKSEHRTPLKTPSVDPALNYGGEEMPTAAQVNLNLAFGSETPVDMFPANENGYHDVIGNVWEWTEDHFNPLTGFKVHKYYDDFSTPCYDGEHQMIMGGSFMSSGDAGANLYSRYHFRPHFLQHSGFRYIRPSQEENVPGEGVAKFLSNQDDASSSSSQGSSNNASADDNVYETKQLVDMYMALHFGQDINVTTNDFTVREHQGLPKEALMFPQRCANLVAGTAKQVGAKTGPNARVLDVGCAVGGSTFQFTKDYGTVVGVDYSEAFVNKAIEMKTSMGNPVEYELPSEGKIVTNVFASLDEQVDPSRATFQVGDACNLPTADEFGGQFDAVLMANLLCRLQEPAKCLSQMKDLIADDGILAIVSPYSWLPQYTDESKWLGGTVANPDASKEVSKLVTSQGFKLISEGDMPLMIREHERKYQYIVSHATVYQKVI